MGVRRQLVSLLGCPDTQRPEADFAAYFDQIVTAMRSVAGEKFQFVWNPDAAAFIRVGLQRRSCLPRQRLRERSSGWTPTTRPGQAPVTPTNAWNVTTLPALTAARAFAAAQGKPLAFCEWGIAFLSNGTDWETIRST